MPAFELSLQSAQSQQPYVAGTAATASERSETTPEKSWRCGKLAGSRAPRQSGQSQTNGLTAGNDIMGDTTAGVLLQALLAPLIARWSAPGASQSRAGDTTGARIAPRGQRLVAA
jgi:hypothetical protein